MYRREIQDLVAGAYQKLQRPGGPGAMFYTDEQLARLPEGARDWALGVGNPVAKADLNPGEIVLDLGCGAGIDALLAAPEVSSTGRVIGIDFLAA
jgi:SAM-dependent methyltransferase